MKYGIPFTRPFTSPFGAPFFGIGSIGPQEPTGFVAKYTSYLVDNFTLVTGDSVNVWQDESVNNNDLTQATSANQPKLVEDFTLTQFTASNQPTFVEGYEGTGAELVTNGDFSGGNTGWNYDPAYLSISGGKCTWNGLASSNLSQSAGLDIGTKYIITFDVSDMTTGALNFRNPSSSTVLSVTANGSYSYAYSALDTFVTFRGASGFDGSIDNISVKEAVANPALDKLDFDTNDYMEGLKPQSGDFTYVFKGLDNPNYLNINTRFIGQLATNTARFLNLAGSFRINDDANGVVFNEPWNNESKIVVRLSGSTLSVFMDGTQLGSDTDVTGSTFTTLTTLGNSGNSFNGSLQSLEIYDVAVADVNNITETPVQTLTADPLKMRTSANLNPTDGQDVAKWYADEFNAYRDARVVFDTGDSMEGLPPQAGDFTYVLTGLDIPTYNSSVNVMLINGDSTNLEKILNDQGNIRINDRSNTVVFLEPWNNESTLVVRLSGNTLSVFAGGVQLGSDTDVTGSVFDNITDLGKISSFSIDGETATLNVFDRALTQTEIDYYSYLRSETGDILLPPLLPS